MRAKRMLYDFDQPADAESWRPVDDVVMGGRSVSQFQVGARDIGVFSGHLFLAGGGGFASVRTQPAQIDLSAYHGLAVRVCGDGRDYHLRLRADPLLDGLVYEVTFPTQAGVWQTWSFAFAEFRPMFHGRPVTGASPLDPGEIYSLGLMVADRQSGYFRLELDWIMAYRDDELAV